MNLISRYYICSFVLKCLELYEGAYTPLRYAEEFEEDMEYYNSFGRGSNMDEMENVKNQNINLWKDLVIMRYGSYVKRVIEYLIFGLSYHHIVPNIGSWYLSKEVVIPGWSNYYQIAYCYDKKYPEFCRQYLTELFFVSGWTVEAWEESEYLKKYSNPLAERYYLEEYDISLGEWHQESVTDSGEECNLYIFTSKENYSREEIVSIFLKFCESGILYLLNDWSVMVSIPQQGRRNGLEFDYNWSEFSPLSALTACTIYLKRKVYGTLFLEEETRL